MFIRINKQFEIYDEPKREEVAFKKRSTVALMHVLSSNSNLNYVYSYDDEMMNTED